MTLVKGIQFKNTDTEEIATITEVNDKYKTVIVELENGKSMTYSFSTIKDKRRWIPVEDAAPVELTDEEISYIENDVEATIEAAADRGLVPMPGIEKLEELKKEYTTTEKPVKKRGALIEWNGKAQNICAWGKELGISPNTLYGRIFNMGWSVERAFTTKKGGK